METNETVLSKRGSTIVKIPVLFGDDTFKVANSVLKKRGGVAKLACHLGKRPDRIGKVKYLKKVSMRHNIQDRSGDCEVVLPSK